MNLIKNLMKADCVARIVTTNNGHPA